MNPSEDLKQSIEKLSLEKGGDVVGVHIYHFENEIGE